MQNVIPLFDSIEHTDNTCECNPTVEIYNEIVVTHNRVSSPNKQIATIIKEGLLNGDLPDLDNYIQKLSDTQSVKLSEGCEEKFLTKMENLRQRRVVNGR